MDTVKMRSVAGWLADQRMSNASMVMRKGADKIDELTALIKLMSDSCPCEACLKSTKLKDAATKLNDGISTSISLCKNNVINEGHVWYDAVDKLCNDLEDLVNEFHNNAQ